MGFTIDGRGGGRKQALSADLNLVPYIDVLTCLVAFLLITAVWTQLASLNVSQKGQGPDEESTPETKVAVVVHDDGFNVIVGDDQKPVPKRAGQLDYAALTSELEAVKAAHPDRRNMEVISYDRIGFDALVRTMDTAIHAGFYDLSLVDAAPGS